MQNYNSKFKIDLKTRCYQFGLEIIILVDKLPNKRAAWIIADQLLRSSMSNGANLAEGTAASSRLEYKKYFEISLKSANESLYWLTVLKDAHFSSDLNTNRLIQEATELAKMLAAGVIKLKSKNF